MILWRIQMSICTSSQSYGFSSSHVQMWELDHKEGWDQRIDAFKLWCWRRPLRVPWTARRSNQSILKEINPEYPLKGLTDAEAEAPIFWPTDAKTQLIGKDLDAGKDGGQEKKEGDRMRWLDGIVRLPGLTGRDLSFGFPWIGKIPHPHRAAWSQPINRHPKGNKGNMRENGKARERLSLNKSLRKFVPIKLLCKHVTNLLKPATNCLCSPYKLM